MTATHLFTRRRIVSMYTLIFFGLAATMGGAVAADSYGVEATVPYPAPTQAAVFDGGSDGITVQDAAFTVKGTCQIMNPVGVISIWRSGAPVGSAVCNQGQFELQIILVSGLNTLTARTANASNLYGPDSQPVDITLVLPPSVEPPAVTVSGNEPSTPTDIMLAINAGADEQLQAVTTQPFSVITDSRTVSIQVVVSGGLNPYNISLNWGDGSTENRSVDQSGTYTFTHTYQKSANYTIHGKIRDKRGGYTTFDYAVVSYKQAPNGTDYVPHMPTPSDKGVVNGYGLYATVFGIIVIGGLLAGNLGYRIGSRQPLPAAKPKKKPVHRKRS